MVGHNVAFQGRLALMLVLLSALAPAFGRVQVAIDPPILSLGESLTVTFSASEQGLREPDFSALNAQFDVLRTNSRETLQIIGGQAQQTKVWRLTLVPREEGTLEIPPIDFGSSSSPSRRITVTAPRAERPGEADVFIEVEVEPRGEVYVQSQVMMTVRLHYDGAVRLSNATLSSPASQDGDLVVEVVAEERSQRQIGERDYKVFEQRYALFPQRSGRLELDPIVFSADMRVHYERPSFRRVQSDRITLDVQPANPGGARPWLPAKAITLEQSFPDTAKDGVIEGRVGEPVTRSVTLSAVGLTSAQLPPVDIPVPDGFKVYPDQPTFDQRVALEGILGERVERLALLPTSPGEFELPAVELEWWDIGADLPRTARLDPVRVRVLPAVGDELAPTATAGGAVPSVRPNASPDPSAAPLAPGAVRYDPGLWPWLALFMAGGWAATGGWWWRSRRMPGNTAHAAASPDSRLPAKDVGPCLKQLQAAVQANDMSAVRRALLRWGQARWPEQTIRHLIDLRQLGGEELARAVDELDAAGYAAREAPWQGGALVQLVERLSASAQPLSRGGGDSLEPLYP